MTTSEALQRLQDGNARIVSGASRQRDWLADLSAGPPTFATILGCSDSRVPPEIVFDQGVGELFIVRVAGNVVGSEILGSLGYAMEHLDTPLCVVLRHEKCGAVQAALQAKFHGVRERRKIGELVDTIVPALEGIDLTEPLEQQWHRGVEANIRWAVRQLVATEAGGEAVAEGRMQVRRGGLWTGDRSCEVFERRQLTWQINRSNPADGFSNRASACRRYCSV